MKSNPEEQNLRAATTIQLESTLRNLKELLGEKKFHSRVKKAAKELTKGLEKNSLGSNARENRQQGNPAAFCQNTGSQKGRNEATPATLKNDLNTRS